jgi:hypothetical protein
MRGISSLVQEPGVESIEDCVPRFQLISNSTIINKSKWGRKHNDLCQMWMKNYSRNVFRRLGSPMFLLYSITNLFSKC